VGQQGHAFVAVDSQCKLLIVVDQFEELLTQAPPHERAEFAAMLEPALERWQP
jgi:hypothetical protein